MDVSSKINGLEGDLRTLITRWDRFFAGELKMPPTREKEILGQRLRALADTPEGAHSGDHFRLEQLQHRFMSYAMNWQRLLREREEGVRRFVPGQQDGVSHAVSPARQEVMANTPPPASVDHVDTDDLFERWCSAKAETGHEVKINRQAFEAQINRQRQDIEKRMDSTVMMDVTVADGKVKLTARRVEKSDGEE
jgi:hypothetical protein